MRWLNIIGGILGIAAGLVTFAWPGITLYVVSIMVACYLIVYGTIHIVSALAGPKLSWWWTGLLFGIAELVLGVWAARSWESSLVTLVTLVGVWAISRGVNEIFAGFTLRQIGKDDRASRLPDIPPNGRLRHRTMRHGTPAGRSHPLRARLTPGAKQRSSHENHPPATRQPGAAAAPAANAASTGRTGSPTRSPGSPAR